MRTSPSISDRLFGKLAASRFFTTSLVIHLTLIGTLGGIAIIQAPDAVPPPFVGEFVLLEDDQSVIDEPTGSNDPIESEPAVKPVALTQNVLHVLDQGLNLPSHNDLVAGNQFDESSVTSIHGDDILGHPGTPGAPNGPTKLPQVLAGIPIESAKLGVILDISGSAHPFLHRPLREIEEGFQNSFVILYSGCGMKGNARRRDYDFKRGNSVKPQQMKDPKAHAENIGQVLDQIGKKNEVLRNGLHDVLARSNIHVTNWSCERGMAIFGVQFAFQRVTKERVDTIYWFADFQDAIDPEVLEETTQDLKRQGIKVICHNFSGKFPNPAQEAAIRKLAEETGGKCIVTSK